MGVKCSTTKEQQNIATNPNEYPNEYPNEHPNEYPNQKLLPYYYLLHNPLKITIFV